MPAAAVLTAAIPVDAAILRVVVLLDRHLGQPGPEHRVEQFAEGLHLLDGSGEVVVDVRKYRRICLRYFREPSGHDRVQALQRYHRPPELHQFPLHLVDPLGATGCAAPEDGLLQNVEVRLDRVGTVHEESTIRS
jgi:hypothetical protein